MEKEEKEEVDQEKETAAADQDKDEPPSKEHKKRPSRGQKEWEQLVQEYPTVFAVSAEADEDDSEREEKSEPEEDDDAKKERRKELAEKGPEVFYGSGTKFLSLIPQLEPGGQLPSELEMTALDAAVVRRAAFQAKQGSRANKTMLATLQIEVCVHAPLP